MVGVLQLLWDWRLEAASRLSVLATDFFGTAAALAARCTSTPLANPSPKFVGSRQRLRK